MLEDYHARIRAQLDRLIRDVPRPNILTLGITGAGKSSLINHVFGNAVAATGTGKPVTQGIAFYDSPARGVGVFDSRGYEFGTKGEELYYRETVGFATNASGDIGQGVHLAWYCIPAESERIHPIDERTIAEFGRIGIPTAVVITKTDQLSYVSLARFARLIGEAVGRQVPLFKTTIVGRGDDREIRALCSWSAASLPESLRLAFTRAQRLILDSKREKAIAIVQAMKADTSAQGFALFGSADEQALNETVFRMAAQILYLYEMEEIRHSLGSVGDLIDDGHRMVAFVAALIEKAAEIIGHFVAEAHGREIGRFVGRMLASFSRSITSQQLIEAIGLSIVSICSGLAEQAVATRGTATPVMPAQIEQQFITEVRKRLES